MAAGFCARRWISERAQLSVAAIAGQGRVARGDDELSRRCVGGAESWLARDPTAA
jgi:hypothetical protein